ncbi:Protein of unknown function [Gryllus bimaculatus]|nr:Protein of unknown function [Gryllus bimaculatus]
MSVSRRSGLRRSSSSRVTGGKGDASDIAALRFLVAENYKVKKASRFLGAELRRAAGLRRRLRIRLFSDGEPRGGAPPFSGEAHLQLGALSPRGRDANLQTSVRSVSGPKKFQIVRDVEVKLYFASRRRLHRRPASRPRRRRPLVGGWLSAWLIAWPRARVPRRPSGVALLGQLVRQLEDFVLDEAAPGAPAAAARRLVRVVLRGGRLVPLLGQREQRGLPGPRVVFVVAEALFEQAAPLSGAHPPVALRGVGAAAAVVAGRLQHLRDGAHEGLLGRGGPPRRRVRALRVRHLAHEGVEVLVVLGGRRLQAVGAHAAPSLGLDSEPLRLRSAPARTSLQHEP